VGTMLCCPSMMLALVAGYCRPTATSTNMKPVYGSAQAPAAAWFRTPVQALELGAVRQGLGGGPAQRQCHNANISRRALATLSSQPKSVCSLRRAAPVPEQVLALAQGHSAAAECTARAANGGSASTAVITHSPGGGRFGGRSCGPSGGLFGVLFWTGVRAFVDGGRSPCKVLTAEQMTPAHFSLRPACDRRALIVSTALTQPYSEQPDQHTWFNSWVEAEAM